MEHFLWFCMGEVTAWGSMDLFWYIEGYNVLCDWLFQSSFHSSVNEEGTTTFNSVRETYIIETLSQTHTQRKKDHEWKENGEAKNRYHSIITKREKNYQAKEKFSPKPHSIMTLKWDWYFINMKKKKKRKKNAGK